MVLLAVHLKPAKTPMHRGMAGGLLTNVGTNILSPPTRTSARSLLHTPAANPYPYTRHAPMSALSSLPTLCNLSPSSSRAASTSQQDPHGGNDADATPKTDPNLSQGHATGMGPGRGNQSSQDVQSQSVRAGAEVRRAAKADYEQERERGHERERERERMRGRERGEVGVNAEPKEWKGDAASTEGWGSGMKEGSKQAKSATGPNKEGLGFVDQVGSQSSSEKMFGQSGGRAAEEKKKTTGEGMGGSEESAKDFW